MENILSNIEMKGIPAEYIKKVKFLLKEEDAFREPIDNAINANPKEINIVVTPEEIMWADDGNGWEQETLEKFAKEMKCHEEIIRNFTSNSLHGIGLKDCLIKLSREDGTSKVQICTAKSKYANVLVYEANISYNNEKSIFTDQKLYTVHNYDKMVGSRITLLNPIHIEDKVLDIVKNSLIFTYSLYNNIKINLNGEEIITEDRCYLKNLGNVDYNDEPSVYVKHGIFYITKNTYIVKDNGDVVSEKITGLFLPLIGENNTNPFNDIKTLNDGPDQINGGIYSCYSNRIIEHGEANVLYHLKRCSNGGGFGKTRILHTMDHSPEVFGISTNKSQKLRHYCNNAALDRKYDGKNSFLTDLQHMWMVLGKLYDKGEKMKVVLTQQEIENIVQETFNKVCRKNYETRNYNSSKVKHIADDFVEVVNQPLPQTYDNIENVILEEDDTINICNIVKSVERKNNDIIILTNSLKHLPEKIKENMVNQILSIYKFNNDKTITSINKDIYRQVKINEFIKNGEINITYKKYKNE